MPDNNTTKNGVNLNTIDVSQLALVDKKNLLDEMSAKLKKDIEAKFAEELEKIATKFDDIGKGVEAQSGGSTVAPREPKEPRAPKEPRQPRTDPYVQDQQAQFEKLRKLRDSVEKMVERATVREKRDIRAQREKALRGSVYSPKGKSYAGDIDELYEDISKADKKEFEKLQTRIAILSENIKLDTQGGEQQLLTKHTSELQKALSTEINQRKSVLGKIEHAFSGNAAIDATAIVAGLTAHSPLIGFATKFVLDRIRDQREEKTKKTSVERQLIQKLPRQVVPEGEEAPKLRTENLRQMLQGTNDPDLRHQFIEELHRNKRISDDQREELQQKFTPPNYTSPAQPQAAPQGAQTGGPAPVQVQPGPAATAPQQVQPPLTVQYGSHVLGVNENAWQEHLKLPKKEREDAEKLAYVRLAQQRQEEKTQKKYEETMAHPLKPGDPNYNFMMDPDVVGPENYYKRSKPQKIFGGAPIIPIPSPAVTAAPQAAQATPGLAALAQAVGHPEQTEEAEPTGAPERVEHTDHLQLEKLAEQQLEELKSINKNLLKQIDQAELDAESKRRETGHAVGGPGGILGTGAGTEEEKKEKGKGAGTEEEKKEKGKGGFWSSIAHGVEEGLGFKVLGKIPGISKLPILGKLFKTGETVAEGVGTVAKGAGTVEKVAEGGGILGGLTKLLPKTGMLGKVLGGSEKLGGMASSLGTWLTPLLAATDFTQGMLNKNLGSKITGVKPGEMDWGDRISAGGAHTAGQIPNYLTFGGVDWLGKKMLGKDPSEMIEEALGHAGQKINQIGRGPVEASGNTANTLQQKIDELKKGGMTDVEARHEAMVDLSQGGKPTAAPTPVPQKTTPPAANANAPIPTTSIQPVPVDKEKKKIEYKPGVIPPEIAEMAAKTEKETGVPAEVTLAQWALESGWGKHSIGNNAFGITKAKRHTMSQLKLTNEDMTPAEFAHLSDKEKASATEADGSPLKQPWAGKKRIKVQREFADFKTLEDSFEDHAKLLANKSGPYATAFAKYKKTGNLSQFIQDISPTYASDRNYASTLQKLVDQGSVAMAANTGREHEGVEPPVMVAAATNPVPVGGTPAVISPAPAPQPPAAPTGLVNTASNGFNIAQASNQNQALKTAMMEKQPTSNNVIAPTNNIVNNNSTSVVDVRAQNTESTYRRNQDLMYVPT